MLEESDSTSPAHRRRIFVAFVAVTAAILALALTKNRLDHYVAEDPKFCKSCHEMSPAVEVWASDSHAKLACQKCHAIDEEQLRTMLVSTVAGASDEPHPKLDAAHIRCESCHLSEEHKRKPVMSSAGHLQHVKSVKVGCLECHGSRVHRIVKPETVCKNCHEELVGASGEMTEVHCQSCHNFLDPDHTIVPSRRDCQGCHDERRVPTPAFPETGHMTKFPCFACHEPHVARDAGEICIECHVRIAANEDHERHHDEKCQRCHEPHGFDVTDERCATHHHTGFNAPKLEREKWHLFEDDPPRDWRTLPHLTKTSTTDHLPRRVLGPTRDAGLGP